jgi:hypothetical protein
LVPQDASAPGTTNGCRSNIASGTAGGGTSLSSSYELPQPEPLRSQGPE